MMDDCHTATSSDNHSPIWDTKRNDAAWKLYKGEQEEADRYCAPARETNYQGLPPAFTFIGTEDAFYAETKTYVHHLYEADIPVSFREYEGYHHAFDLLKHNSKAAAHARSLTKRTFKYAQENFFAKQNKDNEFSVNDLEEVHNQNTQQELDEIDAFIDSLDIISFAKRKTDHEEN